MNIDCCEHCVAPKRHACCHSTCPEYKKQREKLDAHNDLVRRKRQEENAFWGSKGPRVKNFDKR